MGRLGLIFITPDIRLGDHEITWAFARASGAGGQHVNRTESAAILQFHIPSSSLPAPVKTRLLAKADHRLIDSGTLQIRAQEHRSQAQNREAALARLVQFIQSGLTAPKKRRPTKPGKAAKKRRLEGKVRRGDVKSTRRKPEAGE